MQTQSAAVTIVRDDSKPSTIVFPGVCTAEVCVPRARRGEVRILQSSGQSFKAQPYESKRIDPIVVYEVPR